MFSPSVSLTQYLIFSACLSACLSIPVSLLGGFVDFANRQRVGSLGDLKNYDNLKNEDDLKNKENLKKMICPTHHLKEYYLKFF